VPETRALARFCGNDDTAAAAASGGGRSSSRIVGGGGGNEVHCAGGGGGGGDDDVAGFLAAWGLADEAAFVAPLVSGFGSAALMGVAFEGLSASAIRSELGLGGLQALALCARLRTALDAHAQQDVNR
jgi:hypothetical protein